jgi:hypothetical protein
MKFKTNSTESDILVKIVEEPETQISPKLQRIKPLEKTALGIEDFSVLDLITIPHQESVVYIRSFEDEEKIKDLLLRGKDRKSYIFRGIAPVDLKNLFKERTRKIGLREIRNNMIGEDIFQFNYSHLRKKEVYELVSSLHLNYGT